jgi:CAAX protease family protein
MSAITQIGTPETSPQIRQARRGLLVFASLMVPLSLVGYWLYYLNKDTPLPLVADFPPTLMPALAAVITRLVLRKGFADVSFRLGGRLSLRALLLG